MLAAPTEAPVPATRCRLGCWVGVRPSSRELIFLSSRPWIPGAGRAMPNRTCWFAAPRSQSTSTTRDPACAMAMARFEATRLLPTPPLPPPMVMKRLAESSFPGVFMFTPPIVRGLTELEGLVRPAARAVLFFRGVQNRWDDSVAAGLEDDLEQLIYLSNLVGSDPTLTQPGGGNSSLKRREVDFAGRPVDVLRVKGSGTDLRTIGAAGFAGLRSADLAELQGRAKMTDEEMMAFMRASMLDAREPAPSVETPLHSVLPYRFIVHTHDFATQALTDTPRPRELVAEALGPAASYIDYVRPGFPLARAVMDLGPPPAEARGLVLGRHGLIAWGDTAKDCYLDLVALISAAEAFLPRHRAAKVYVAPVRDEMPPAERRARACVVLPVRRWALAPRPVAPGTAPRSPILHLDDSPEALAFVGSPRALALSARGMSTPEHILRCGRVPLALPEGRPLGTIQEAATVIGEAMTGYAGAHEAAYERHRALAGPTMLDASPRVVLAPGLGLITAMKDKTNALVGNACYRHVMRVME